MVFGKPEMKSGPLVPTDAEGSPEAVVPPSEGADAHGEIPERNMADEAHPHIPMAFQHQSSGHSVDADYCRAPGEHDLGSGQALISFLLIVVTVTVACILITLMTRYSKDYRAGARPQEHRLPFNKTSLSRLRH
ncbi:hypothetical protein MTO96_048861 [Rhipicephalus appendiculatus]